MFGPVELRVKGDEEPHPVASPPPHERVPTTSGVSGPDVSPHHPTQDRPTHLSFPSSTAGTLGLSLDRRSYHLDQWDCVRGSRSGGPPVGHGTPHDSASLPVL